MLRLKTGLSVGLRRWDHAPPPDHFRAETLSGLIAGGNDLLDQRVVLPTA